MSTINIYRLFDPLDIQQLQPDIERSACATPTGGFMPGFTVCTVYDNGFWTLENTLTEGGFLAPKYKTIEEAVEGVAVFMRDFDIAIGGGKPLRAANANEKSFDWNTVQPNNRPPQFRDGYATPKAKDSKKPKFFENVSYLGGRSMKCQKGEQQLAYWRLVYGVQVKPSNEAQAVAVEDVEVVIEVWTSGVIRKIIYLSVPVKNTELDNRILTYNSNLKSYSLCYFMNTDLNYFLPYLKTA